MKRLLFSLTLLFAMNLFAQDYVDLGLPSGTLWKSKNEKGGLYYSDDAVKAFGDNLPCKEQFGELLTQCKWSRKGKGYEVVGPNGNSIFLPAKGIRRYGGKLEDAGSRVYYWSSSPSRAFTFENSIHIMNMASSSQVSVRLVQGNCPSDTSYLNQLIADALKRGVGSDDLYRIENTREQYIEEQYAKKHLEKKGYIVLKTEMKQSRGGATVFDWVTFTTPEEYKALLAPPEYVDLGLPSKTLWANKYEFGGNYNYDRAVSRFGSSMPTTEQLEELKQSCTWTWTNNGYTVVGPNGNSIFLQAKGYETDPTVGEGQTGGIWSATPAIWASASRQQETAWALQFSTNNIITVEDKNLRHGLSVRLVQGEPQRIAAEQAKNSTVTRGGKGTFFYIYKSKGTYNLGRIDHVRWDGLVVNGLLEGKGAGGYLQNGIKYSFIGEFSSGILLSPSIRLAKSNSQGPLPEADLVPKSSQFDKIDKGVVINTHSKDTLFLRARDEFVYHVDAATLLAEYNNALAVNNPEYTQISLVTTKHELWESDEYEYWLYKNYTSVNNSDVGAKIKMNYNLLCQIEAIANNEKKIASQDMILKAKEMLELFTILEVYSRLTNSYYTSCDYKGGTSIFSSDDFSFNQKRAEQDRDQFFEVLDIVKKKQKSSESSFKAFYSRIYPTLVEKEDFFRNEFIDRARNNFYRFMKEHDAKMCDACMIDGKYSTVPQGYVEKEEGLFTVTPARSEKEGRILLKNGQSVLWKYEWNTYTNEREIEIEANDIGLGYGNYKNEKEFFNAIVEACKKKYCR